MTSAFTVQRLRPIILFFGSSFLLHLLWENLQAPLYEGFTSFRQHFRICFKATWGDLLFMLLIYIVLAILHRDLFWVTNRSAHAHPATWFAALLVGILLTVSFEFWAISIDHRWQYTQGMPLIPLLQIGLAPVLQMVVIPPLVLLSTYHFSRHP